MAFLPWQLAVMEDYGLMTTKEGLINRVARYLADNAEGTVDESFFRDACFNCDVDPDCFTDYDLEKLQKKLDELTR